MKGLWIDMLSGGGLLLVSLRKAGVDRFFINSGTEYSGLLLDYMHLSPSQRPEMVVCLSETTAVAAAYGYSLMNENASAVMVHTVPGVASALPNLFNAYTAGIPIILISGVTSYSSRGRRGSRQIRVHWGQDVRDIRGLVRQFVKWDYVVNESAEIPEAVSRAVEVAMSPPQGPVYLGIHREHFMANLEKMVEQRPPIVSQPPSPNPSSVKKIAERLASANYPVILTRSAGRNAKSFHLLKSLAEMLCARVNYAVADYVNFPNTSIFSAPADLRRADCIVALESDVPWLPAEEWPMDVFRVSVGTEPLNTRMNVWGFGFDEAVYAETSQFLESLLHQFESGSVKVGKDLLEERRAVAENDWRRWRRDLEEALRQDESRGLLTKRLASHILGEALPQNFIIVNEYSLRPDYLLFDEPGTYFGEPPGGSLGWGLGAALGIKLAKPEVFVSVVLGDGSFVFNNPVSGAVLSKWYRLPVLLTVFNDGCWWDVKKSLADMGFSEFGKKVEGVDFPEPLDVYSMGRGMGFSSYVAEKPRQAAEALREAVADVLKGVTALVDLRVRADS
ncbi:acetolactate synthase I/II/III large subunit [Candidatus Caldarchaeum subterraneum]|uniref:Acetolactate synthase I/II/III large subunit n=1 Tax=Caldiarchaeum subterraneum TaxID=311458 RepID=Q4LEE5_CALS0|nr:acetolactate synthase large subunit homolog (ilvB-6) [Candidatus Caldarchaeum subterraneum]BAJ51591.1 acetolactate synthase I/II/III large subunit [Candidatus Caldarchaeum subterraneum]